MKNEAFNRAMGAGIRKLRTMRGLSQADVSKVLGISYQQVQKSESGTNGFASHYLPVIAQLLGVTIAELFEEARVLVDMPSPTAAQNDAILAARYVAKIGSQSLRRNIIDFARKSAYEEAHP